MKSHKDTYEYCEQLIRREIDNILTSSTFHTEERSTTFTSCNVTFDQLKDLYKHLENIQQMKKSYITGR